LSNKCRGALVRRYYDPTTEQFLSVDPLVDETGTPYAFTGGDPVNESDPSGASILGAIFDSINPISSNNVFYRFGYHHPLAGRVLAIGTGAAAGGIAVGAACVAFCLPAAAALGIGGAAAEDNPGLLSRIVNQCQAFVGDETGAVGGAGDEQTVNDVLQGKFGSITRAPLPAGSPSWDEVRNMTMSEIEKAAQANEPGYKTILKLLTDSRFNKP